MNVPLLSLIVLGLAALGYVLAYRRALSVVDGDTRLLHSRIGYYGQLAFLLTAVPAAHGRVTD